ncbi:MAG TPA: L,D-transpeptidase family protein [Chthoniobacterales bacterium]|nr:L,D-transpeptidase family protein [Chthoniobacterales bacterium]
MTSPLLPAIAATLVLFACHTASGQTTLPRRPAAPPSTAGTPPASGKTRVNRPKPTPAAAPLNQPMRKASDLIKAQPPLTTDASVLQNVTPDNARVLISISKQRAYLIAGDQVAADSPISSGKRGHTTPTGSFTILQKDKDHRSNIYGDYKDSKGRTVRGGISAHIDSAPSGTRFVGAPMKWFMRLTNGGVGMHVGILPGYPASHGCVRMPEPAAALFYSKVKVGTPAVVEP